MILIRSLIKVSPMFLKTQNIHYNFSKYNRNLIRNIFNHPYARLCRYNKLTGMLLLYWPCTWGIALASTGYPNIYPYMLFFIGSLGARAAGCILNDYFDRDIDRQVVRTINRPLAAKQVSNNQALSLFILNMSVGLFCFIQLNPLAQIICLFIFPIVAIYPLAKKHFKYPQLVLGIVFNSGIIIGVMAYKPILSSLLLAIPLYFIGILWTLIYDTIYAFQDIQDDKKLLLNSTAIQWQSSYQKIFRNILTSMLALTTFCVFIDHSFIFGLPIAYSAHFYLWFQLKKVNIKVPQQCAIFFLRNNYFGVLILLALLFRNIFQKKQQELDKL